MTFVTTGLAIAGACAIAIPILIHLLFRRRRRPIEWAAMRFLLEAFRKHRRRLQLEQLLLLLVRCLIVLVAGTALARPLLQEAGILAAGGTRSVMLIVDNSMVSGIDAGDQTALHNNIDAAIEIIEMLEPGDSVALITSARPAAGLVVPPSTDHEAIIELLREMEPTTSASDLPAALGIAREAIDEIKAERNKIVVYLLSEFREGSASLEAPLPEALLDLGEQVTLLAAPPTQTPAPNTQVIEVDPVRSFIVAGESEGLTQVTVRLARRGGDMEAQTTRVKLSGPGLALLEPREIQWEPGQTRAGADFLVDFDSTSGASLAALAALTAQIDHDLLSADNARHTVVQLRDRVRIILADRRSFSEVSLSQLAPGQWMKRALAPYDQGPMEIIEVDPAALDVQDLRVADAVLLPRPDLMSDKSWAALSDFVKTGGLLIVTPPAELNVHPWTDQLVQAMDLPWQVGIEAAESSDGWTLAAEQPPSELLRLIASDLPELIQSVVVNRRLEINASQTSAERGLVLADGSPLLIYSAPQHDAGADGGSDESEAIGAIGGRGLVIFLAAAPDGSAVAEGWTNLPTQPLMVALMQEMVRQGVSLVRASQQIQVGSRPALGLSRAASSLKSPDGDFIPLDARGRPTRGFEQAGLYVVMDSARQPIGAIAVNVDPEAGRTETQSQAAVSAWLARTGAWQSMEMDDPAAILRTVRSGLPLAGMLLLALLALIVIETLMARYFSHAFRTAPGTEGFGGTGLRGGMGLASSFGSATKGAAA